MLNNCNFVRGPPTQSDANSIKSILHRILLEWDDDPDGLTISLHQDRLYPRNSGMREERGVGTNINIPLPAGTGNGGYLYAFETVVRPALKKLNQI